MNCSLPRILALATFVCLLATRATAGLYGEHKNIGDEGFEKFLKKDPAIHKFFHDTLGLGTIATPLLSRGLTEILHFNSNGAAYGVSYGDINGISGDHTRDPVEVYYGLATDSMLLFDATPDPQCGPSAFTPADIQRLQQQVLDAIRLHHEAMAKGEKAASNFAFGLYYVLLSYEDESHFHYVGVSANDELADLTPELRNLFITYRACLFSTRERLIDRLNHVNVSAKYTMLHCLALDMMHTAGIFWNSNRDIARIFLMKALLYNGYADHYLEDTFAAGHIVVRRNALHALDDNGKHDYYGRVGLFVHNRRGDRWLTKGDGYIEPGEETQNFASEAVAISLNEIWNEFDASRAQPGRPSPLEHLAALPGNSFGKTIVAEYRAFDIIPVEIAKEDVYLANSRSGTFLFGALGTKDDFHTPGFWHAGVGFGLKFAAPPASILDREYDVWAAGTLGYANGGINAATDADKWWEWRFGLEGTFYDLIQAGIDNGLRYQEGVARWLWNPYVGLEFKRPGWSFAPSIRANYEVIARRKPVPGLEFEVRFY